MFFGRIWKWLIVYAMAIGLVVAWTAYLLLQSGWLYEPLWVNVVGLPLEMLDEVEVYYSKPDQQLYPLARHGPPFTWFAERIPIGQLYVRLPVEALPKVDKALFMSGDAVHLFGGAEVKDWPRQTWQRRGTDGSLHQAEVLHVPLPQSTSLLSGVPAQVLNWSGDAHFSRQLAQYAAVPILMVVLVAWFHWQRGIPGGRDRCRRLLGVEETSVLPQGIEQGPASGRHWNLFGVIVLVCGLVALEVQDPYYFTQCDNLVDCLPSILVGCRSVWQGVAPYYNPYTMLGGPLMNLGFYSLTYPPLYVSYALARHVLGQEYMTVEIFVILHLLVSFWGMRRLARAVGMHDLAANLAALSFVFSGMALILGRSWYNFVPIMVWLPLVFWGLVRLSLGPVGWRWVLGMGIAFGLAFHVGFSQTAVYMSGFFCLAVLWLMLCGTLPLQRARLVLCALLVGMGIALPLVYQQWLLTRGLNRYPVSEEGIGWGLPAFLLPYPLVEAPLPTFWGNWNEAYMGHFYFFGGILAFAFLYQCVGLMFFRPSRRAWAAQVWTIGGVLAFWLGLGKAGGLWTLLSYVPVMGLINRYPFRIMPVLVFFMCLSGGLVVERWMSESKRRIHTERWLAIAAVLVLAVHLSHCRTAFQYYFFRPYPELPSAVTERLWEGDQVTGRVFCWALHSGGPEYGSLLPQNLPAAYRLPTMQGYNSMLETSPLMQQVYQPWRRDPIATLKAYGVRWHFCQPTENLPWLDGRPPRSVREVLWMPHQFALWNRTPASWPVVASEAGALVTELEGTDALAFVEAKPRQGLPIQLHGQGLDVNIDSLPGRETVIVNFLHYPDMVAVIDGEPIPLQSDAWNRIKVSVPSGHHVLSIRYVVRWGTGLLMGLAAATLGVGLAWLWQRGTSFMEQPIDNPHGFS